MHFETTFCPITEKDEITGFTEITRDITDRKRAEETLRKSEQKYRNLVESTDDWVWACDIEGRQTFATETVKNILGYEVSEIMGGAADTFMRPEDGKRVRKWHERRDPPPYF